MLTVCRAERVQPPAPPRELDQRWPAALPATPEEQYAELFVAVQTAQLFDQKTFVDAVPKGRAADIVASYRAEQGQAGFDLGAFVRAHFSLPVEHAIQPPRGQSLREHIGWLWPRLERRTPTVPAQGSLIALPRPYVVPGGRFREIYYWDSYFTMLGLERAGEHDRVDALLEDFAHLIDRFGHIPNGNRSYYLSRSQPPFFSHMVEFVAQRSGPSVYLRYASQLQREHAFWMAGEQGLRAGEAAGRVVKLADGTLLNRYWDELATPRSESYLQDLLTARQAPQRAAARVYRDLRAAAESGWDFSSRWLADGKSLATIVTTSIVPVDLNSLLHHLERTIVRACALGGDRGTAQLFQQRAERRARAIEQLLWNPAGHYDDYDWERRELRAHPSAAMFLPLFTGIASGEHARQTARCAEALLLKQWGLATTTLETDQQWDAPNGWAPLHWMAVQGLRRYHQPELAECIGARFLARVEAEYRDSGKLVEKYAVEGSATGGGGEYPLQDGFGWTNGVTLRLLDLYGASGRHAPSVPLRRSPPAPPLQLAW
jgi:alpha,alpha-trehalase